MSSASPSRHAWAATCLEANPADHLLEIGVGSGQAASLLLPHLQSGSFTGLDRSATALAKAARTLKPWAGRGRVLLHRGNLEAPSLSRRFDRAFAINVNAFWLKPVRALRAVHRLLEPSGVLLLVFEPPSQAQIDRIRYAILGALGTVGFTDAQFRLAPLAGGPGIAVRARARSVATEQAPPRYVASARVRW